MHNKEYLMKTFKEWVGIVAEALVVVLILFFFCWPMKVFGTSMEKTLKTGDKIAVSKFLSVIGEYERGDIITFSMQYVDDSMAVKKIKVIKRIIAMENDHLQIKYGKVYVNGEFLEEPYANGIIGEEMDIIVPEGYVFVLGDNRDDSIDSRTLGPILKDSITGKILFKWYPFNEMSMY